MGTKKRENRRLSSLFAEILGLQNQIRDAGAQERRCHSRGTNDEETEYLCS
jgi:hypothetical protein